MFSTPPLSTIENSLSSCIGCVNQLYSIAIDHSATLRSAGRQREGLHFILLLLPMHGGCPATRRCVPTAVTTLHGFSVSLSTAVLLGLRTYDIQELRTPTQNIHFPPALSTGLYDRFNRADKTFWGVNVKKKSTFGLVLDRRSCF